MCYEREETIIERSIVLYLGCKKLWLTVCESSLRVQTHVTDHLVLLWRAMEVVVWDKVLGMVPMLCVYGSAVILVGLRGHVPDVRP